jgi:hypothetical protein
VYLCICDGCWIAGGGTIRVALALPPSRICAWPAPMHSPVCLPPCLTGCLQAASRGGKPLILVLIHGGPLDISPLLGLPNVAAVLTAWWVPAMQGQV